MKKIAVMPWISLSSPARVLGCEARTYRLGGPDVPEDLRRVAARYHNAAGGDIHEITLVEIDGQVVSEYTDEQIERAFRAALIMTFTALARRRFFSDDGYINTDAFTLVFQPAHESDEGIVSVETRHRDGTTSGAMSIQHYRVRRPNHVRATGRITLDAEVLASVEAACSSQHWGTLAEVLQFFNRANTDGAVSLDEEIVGSVGAAERLLGARSKESTFAHAMLALLSPHIPKPVAATCSTRPGLAEQHAERTLLEAWARALYQARHNPAHGKGGQLPSNCWRREEHLLMVAYALPRLVLAKLQSWGLYTLNAGDRREVRAIERLLKLPDLFGKTEEHGIPHFHWHDAFRVITHKAEDGSELDEQIEDEGLADDEATFDITYGPGSPGSPEDDSV